jgi:hypothetical protein
VDNEDIEYLGLQIRKVAEAITPAAAAGRDETGGNVASLTEATMGVTAGLCKIAEAIDGLAAAIERATEAIIARE